MKVVPEVCHDSLRDRCKQKLSYSDGVCYSEWKNEIKAKFCELIGLDKIKENACELNFEIESEVQKDGYKQIRFTIESEKDCVIPVYILIPDSGKDKYPVAITMQGHSSGFHNSIGEPKSEKEEEYALGRGQFAVQAVKRGYIAVAIEQRGMGELRPLEHLRNMSQMCAYEAMTAIMMGRTLVAERVWAISRVIDALSNFSQCDLSDIFITGNSGGGTISYYAACLDERIKLSAPSCAVCTYKGSILNIFHCACNYIPDAYNWFEMGDLSCMIAPRKLLVISGKDDAIFPIDEAKKAYITIQKIFEKEGVPQNCKMLVTDKDHYWYEDVVWNGIKQMRGEI